MIMKIDETTLRLSEKVSKLIKELSFVGVGIIWIFKDITTKGIELNETLVYALFFCVCAVSLQFLQYLAQSIICASYSFKKKNLPIKSIWYWLPWIIWGISVVSLILAYGSIICFFGKKIILLSM